MTNQIKDKDHYGYEPGNLVIVRRGAVNIHTGLHGTMIARLLRFDGRIWWGMIFSVSSLSWTKSRRPIFPKDIIGIASRHANAKQRRAFTKANLSLVKEGRNKGQRGAGA